VSALQRRLLDDGLASAKLRQVRAPLAEFDELNALHHANLRVPTALAAERAASNTWNSIDANQVVHVSGAQLHLQGEASSEPKSTIGKHSKYLSRSGWAWSSFQCACV
jgi:hypothetical protein